MSYKWFGELPEHWDERLLKQVCEYKKVKNEGNREKLVLSLSYGNIIRKDNIVKTLYC